MRITVVGKAHLEGTSKKTGRDYNFNQVHFLGPARGVEGQAAQTISLDPQIVPYPSIEVGAAYNAEFDPRGNCVAFDRCERPGK
jgi:hypothetical protein